MAHNCVEERLNRSQLFNQHGSGIFRLGTPVSSTGSCHGTVTSDSVSDFFTDLDEHIVNGNICNSTAILDTSNKHIKNNNINNSWKTCSTTRKHGRWEPRTPIFNETAIASAFPDFASFGAVSISENKITTNGKDLSIEIARGHKYAPNTASPRQSQPLKDFKHIPKAQQNSISLTKSTIDPPLKALLSKNSSTIPKIGNEIKIGEAETNSEKKITTRSASYRATLSPPFSSDVADVCNVDTELKKCYRTRVRDEMDKSFQYGDQITSTTTVPNSTDANTNLTKQLTKAYSIKKSSRFGDAQNRAIFDEKTSHNSNEVIKSTLDTQTRPIEDTDIPFERSCCPLQNFDEAQRSKLLGNPTLSTSTFLIPWTSEIQTNSPPKSLIPVFTAQGKVQDIRLPHEYVDGIDLPDEENQIYYMIGNVKHEKATLKETVNGSKSKSIISTEEKNISDSANQRENGLEENNCENLTSNFGKKNDKNYIQKTNTELDQNSEMPNQNDKDLDYKIRNLSTSNENLKHQNSTLLAANKELVAENWARGIEIRDLMVKTHNLTSEKSMLEKELNTVREALKDKDRIYKVSSKELDDLKHEREQSLANLASKTQQYESRLESLKRERDELHKKLSRSEKSRKILKDSSQKIMESTRKLEITEVKKSFQNYTTSKDNEFQSKMNSKSSDDEAKSCNQAPIIRPMTAGENYDLTIDSNLSDVSCSVCRSSVNSTQRNTIDANTSVSHISNYSDMLGHGFAEDLRSRVESFQKFVEQQQHNDNQIEILDTLNTTKLENNNQSIKPLPPLNTTIDTFASRAHQTQPYKTHQRSKSLTEKNITTSSKFSTHRHSTVTARAFYNPPSSNTINTMTPKLKKREKSFNTESLDSFHRNCSHHIENCTICLRESLKKNTRNSKTTIRVQKPIPVSERIKVPEQFGDQPTLRPSIAPGIALARVIKTIKDEIEHLSEEYQKVQKLYMLHDPTLNKNSRKALSNSMKTLLGDMEVKKDQLYALFDVLEGQKIANQEMSVEFIDVTLTDLRIDLDVTWNGCENE